MTGILLAIRQYQGHHPFADAHKLLQQLHNGSSGGGENEQLTITTATMFSSLKISHGKEPSLLVFGSVPVFARMKNLGSSSIDLQRPPRRSALRPYVVNKGGRSCDKLQNL